ncbi:MAG TPA: hypothetical protein PLB91_06945 [Spirochaetales bacterium]|nr:hypothetical protein [Spirochaetales bacterium]HRY52999.1 hypothetical protein [Spirochaetia bacterium]
MAGSIDYGTSWVALCNRALARLGKDRISSLSSGDETVNLCNVFLGEAIETVLSAYSWNAAKARVQLAMLATDPAYGYSNAFALPSDMVNIASVDAGGADYRHEGSSILTDAAEVWITYIARPTDPKALPAYLKRAISAELAYLLSTPIATSETLAARIKAEAQAALEEAIAADARRSPPQAAEPFYTEAR